MDVWDGEGDCNKFVGTDSTIFSPLMKRDEGVWAFAPDLCRSLGATAKKDVTYAKMPAVRYSIEFGDIKVKYSKYKQNCFVWSLLFRPTQVSIAYVMILKIPKRALQRELSAYSNASVHR